MRTVNSEHDRVGNTVFLQYIYVYKYIMSKIIPMYNFLTS